MLEIDDRFDPGFNHRLYERECPRPVCDGMVTFHFARVHEGTHGRFLDNACSLDIATKCKHCGHLEYAQPPISDDQRRAFEERWDGVCYLPWSEETGDGRDEIERVYNDDEAERIRERLDALGYI